MNETVNPQGNPQGKGLVMVLQQMAAAAPAEIRPKSADEALLDGAVSGCCLPPAPLLGPPFRKRVCVLAS